MKSIRCKLKDRAYSVHIGQNIFKHIPILLKKHKVSGKVCVVTNATVGRLYYSRLARELKKLDCTVMKCVVPDSEKAKTEKELFSILEHLVDKNFDRSSTIIALGGGIVGDLSGFCAAVFMRGIRFINIPTTLLSQVDSAIGGKTGINLKNGKNLVGSFYQPQCVISDVAVLKSLSVAQLSDSLSEVIKYGVIWDKRFFVYLEKNIQYALQGKRDVLEHIVETATKIKTRVVEEDERETKGLRAILNFGHTFAHAFESYGKYTKISHGCAVGLGMVVAARLAVRLGMFTTFEALRIESLVQAIGQSISAKTYFGKRLDPVGFSKDIVHYMQFDKKNKDKRITLVLPKKIGTVVVQRDHDVRFIKEAIASVVV